MRFLVVLALPGEKAPEVMVHGTDDLAEAQDLTSRAQAAAEYWARDIVGGYPGTVQLIDTADPAPEMLQDWVMDREEAAQL